MKKISYQYCVKANNGTEENPNWVDTFQDKILSCYTEEEYEKAVQIAQQEACNGEYTVEEVKEPEAPSEPSVWDELDAAYREGVDSI